MKIIQKLYSSMLVFVLLSSISCQSQTSNTTSTGTSPIPTVSTIVGQAADDIIFTPGGPAYRANVHEAGPNNPWPEVQTVIVQLSGNDAISLRYRENIETKAGETRNNILGLSGVNIFEKQGTPVVFVPLNLSAGIAAIEEQTTIGPMTAAVMQIGIPPLITAGDYTFNIHVEIDGKDYGQVPCTITVID